MLRSIDGTATWEGARRDTLNPDKALGTPLTAARATSTAVCGDLTYQFRLFVVDISGGWHSALFASNIFGRNLF